MFFGRWSSASSALARAVGLLCSGGLLSAAIIHHHHQEDIIPVIVDYSEAIDKSRALIRRLKVFAVCVAVNPSFFQEYYGIPGIGVTVSVNGKCQWKEGFGYADVENGLPYTAGTVMRIASISKSISTAVMAQLVDEGLLDLDAPVQKYVPEFPDKKWNSDSVTITTRHLASNTSGIRHYKGTSLKSLFSVAEFNVKEHFTDVITTLKFFKDDPLVIRPGSGFLYSTFGFSLLSAVLERASGRSFPHLVQDLFDLLSMRDTFLDQNDPLILHRCRYYRRNHGHLQNVPFVDNSYKWAAGGLLSSAEDLLRFGNALLASSQMEGGFLEKETAQALFQPVIDSNKGGRWYGLGWSIIREPRSLVFHTGSAVGASSVILILPGKEGRPPRGTVVVILANLQGCKVGLRDTAKNIALSFEEAEGSDKS